VCEMQSRSVLASIGARWDALWLDPQQCSFLIPAGSIDTMALVSFTLIGMWGLQFLTHVCCSGACVRVYWASVSDFATFLGTAFILGYQACHLLFCEHRGASRS
jgi:hypothetical protein